MSAPDDIPVARSGGNLVEALASAQHLPEDALRRALVNPERIAPDVLRLVGEAASGAALSERDQNLLFWGIHVLGAARDARLCGPLLGLAVRSDDATLDLLGDAVTATLARIVIGSFDGAPAPLEAAIADPGADSFVRWSLLNAYAYLAWSGAISRADAAAFLARFDAERLAPGGDPAWTGWEEAVALLGLEELAPRVAAAREDARLLDEVSDPEWFALTLAEAVARPESRARFDDKGLGPIQDLVAELDEILGEGEEGEPEEPLVNPLRHVGRNDPCPCGSGKKFKKCCLEAA